MILGMSAFVYRVIPTYSTGNNYDQVHNAELEKPIFISHSYYKKAQGKETSSVLKIEKEAIQMADFDNDYYETESFILKYLTDNYKEIFKGYEPSFYLVKNHIDISLLKDTSDELDIDKFKAWRKEFANAEFILEEDGKYITGREVEKMSKSKYNVVNPDDICEQYGADTLRLYEMFLGPLEQAKPWNTAGISGVYNFLRKLWRLYFNDNSWQVTDEAPTPEMLKALHKTIKKVNEDIENFSFNTSVSQFMICVNELSSLKCHHRDVLAPLSVLVAPFAPHIAEELWKRLGNTESVTYAPYPVHEDRYLQEDSKEYPVSFNGKVRFKRAFATTMTPAEIEQAILADPQTAEQLQGNTPKKVIVVPNRIINIVM